MRPVTEYATLAVGVLNKRFSNTNKLYGAQISFTNKQQDGCTVKILLDANKKSLHVLMSGQPEQSFDLPKEGGTFIPTVQLKSGKAVIVFKFEASVPKDLGKIIEMTMDQEELVNY